MAKNLERPIRLGEGKGKSVEGMQDRLFRNQKEECEYNHRVDVQRLHFTTERTSMIYTHIHILAKFQIESK